MMGHSLKALWLAFGSIVVAGTISAGLCAVALVAVAGWLAWGRA